jgi:hypothetical protein
MNNLQYTYLPCECASSEHAIVFVLDKENKELWLEIHLNTYLPWWKRVWSAIKYIFGYKSEYGHFDCWMMRPDDANKIIELMKEISKI